MLKYKFKDNGKGMGSPTFSSPYYCYNFLPKQIVMEKLNKPTKRGKKDGNSNNKLES